MKPILKTLCSLPLLVGILFLASTSSTSYGQGAPQTGTFTDTLKFSNGTSMKFKARVPMSLPKEKTLGLILAFHPHGGNENSMVDWPSKTFLERQGAVDDYVIIGLKSRRPNGYKEHLGDWEKALEEAKNASTTGSSLKKILWMIRSK